MSGSLVRTESIGCTRISLTTPVLGRADALFHLHCLHHAHFLASRHAVSGTHHDGYDAAGHGGTDEVAVAAGGVDTAGGRRDQYAWSLRSASPRAAAGPSAETIHLNGECLTFDGYKNGRPLEVANLDVVPIIPYPDAKPGYRQPRLPVLPDWSCSRRRNVLQVLDCTGDEGCCIVMASATPIAAATSLSGRSLPFLLPV